MHGLASPAASAAAYALFVAEEKALLNETEDAGKQRYQKWRMDHAHAHFNVQPGKYGEPLMHIHTDDMVLDALHGTDINLCYPALKRLLSNCSDAARLEQGAYFEGIKHKLDCRAKSQGRRVEEKKWNGE
eukprot:4268340-Pleurochrysis_carterae.AAC.1